MQNFSYENFRRIFVAFRLFFIGRVPGLMLHAAFVHTTHMQTKLITYYMYTYMLSASPNAAGCEWHIKTDKLSSHIHSTFIPIKMILLHAQFNHKSFRYYTHFFRFFGMLLLSMQKLLVVVSYAIVVMAFMRHAHAHTTYWMQNTIQI